MHSIHGEGRQAYSDVFRPFFTWSAITNPLTTMCNYGLARADIQASVPVLHAQRPF